MSWNDDGLEDGRLLFHGLLPDLEDGLLLADEEDLQRHSSAEGEAAFHLNLMAADLMPFSSSSSLPSLLARPHDQEYLSLGTADPNDVLRSDAGGPRSSSSCRRVEGFLDAEEVERYLGANCPPPLEEDEDEDDPPPGAAEGQAEAAAVRRKGGARHRHSRKFLPEGEEKRQRGRMLNNEASQLYRRRRKERDREDVQQLQRLEEENRLLRAFYRQLRRHREECSKYREYLPSAHIP